MQLARGMVDGARLKAAREGAGLTQEDLAGKLGVHRNTIIRAEKNEHELRFTTIVKLARACGVSVESLATETTKGVSRKGNGRAAHANGAGAR